MEKAICPNCGQWQNESGDCFNECRARGFVREHPQGAIFTTVGRFRLVHLDNPSQDVIEERRRMVADGSFWVDDCPICRAQKEHGGDIVFDPEILDHDDWIIEVGRIAKQRGFVPSPRKAELAFEQGKTPEQFCDSIVRKSTGHNRAANM